MIELDSVRWTELRHAYGMASDLPGLLTQLREGNKESLDTLFGSICHQGSVYSSSFAAFPHLVSAAAAQADSEFRAQILILVGSIYSSPDYRGGDQVAPDIMESYKSVLPVALDLSVATLRESIDETTAIYLLEASSALRGFDGPGRVLSGFASREFTAICPSCKKELYIWPESHQLSVAAEDPVSFPKTKRTFTQPGPVAGSGSATAYQWIADRAKEAHLTEVTALLPHLFGSAVCPGCGKNFNVMECVSESRS